MNLDPTTYVNVLASVIGEPPEHNDHLNYVNGSAISSVNDPSSTGYLKL
jgi:hypothetical protein